MTAMVSSRDEAGGHIDREQFRELFRAVPSAVSVVATRVGERIHATTVSAFCSLSAEPALLMLALDSSSALLGHLRVTQRFGLNVLAHDQAEIALMCAVRGDEKVVPSGWDPDRHDPHLASAVAWCACRVEALVNGGDHVIVIGRIVEALSRPELPLLYHRQRFHELGAANA